MKSSPVRLAKQTDRMSRSGIQPWVRCRSMGKVVIQRSSTFLSSLRVVPSTFFMAEIRSSFDA